MHSILTTAALALFAVPHALAAPAAAVENAAKTVTVTSTTTVVSTSTVSVTGSCSGATSAASSSVSSSAPATTTSSSVITNEYPTSTAVATATGKRGLNDYAKLAGKKYFGTAVDIPGPETNDIYYMRQLNNTRDFGQLVPTNYQKWFATEPQRGVFNFTGGDQVPNIARANGQLLRCHNLLWHNQLPDWITSQTWDNATLTSIIETHVTALVKHYGTRCYAWDVVNEALEEDGTYRKDIFLDTIGPSYIDVAFRAAARAAPRSVKLYYNDYNIEKPGNKSTAAQKIVSSLKKQGIRIDGVGLQSHFVVGSSPSQADQEANMAAFAALGVEVAVTELDIRHPSLPPTVEMQIQQKKDYYATVKACVTIKACVGVTLWDFVDQYSWIPGVFAGQGAASPWFKEQGTGKLVVKAAYDGIVEALTGKPVSNKL